MEKLEPNTSKTNHLPQDVNSSDQQLLTVLELLIKNRKFIFIFTIFLSLVISASVFYQEYTSTKVDSLSTKNMNSKTTISTHPLRISIPNDIIYSWLLFNVPGGENSIYQIYSTFIVRISNKKNLFRNPQITKLDANETIVLISLPLAPTQEITNEFLYFQHKISDLYNKLQRYRTYENIVRIAKYKGEILKFINSLSFRKEELNKLFDNLLVNSNQQKFNSETVGNNLEEYNSSLKSLIEFMLIAEKYVQLNEKEIIKNGNILKIYKILEQLREEFNYAIQLLNQCKQMETELAYYFDRRNVPFLNLPLTKNEGSTADGIKIIPKEKMDINSVFRKSATGTVLSFLVAVFCAWCRFFYRQNKLHLISFFKS